MKNKIAIIIGTKAELIKTFPVMLELQKRNKNYWFIHTGQHPLGNACKEFKIKQPDFVLSKEPNTNTKFFSKINKNSISWSISMMIKIRKLLKKLNPSKVLYHGDTMSTAIASLASSKILNPNKKWENIHLEAGLRSHSIFEPFPEEISRKISSKFSDTLLAVSETSKKQLNKKSQKVINTGNTIVDSANIIYNQAKHTKPNQEYALLNLHRHENLKSKKRMKQIIEILKHTKIKILWPLHDNTEHHLQKYNLMKEIKKMKNIQILPLMNYSKFIFFLANCKYLIADGGSIQEESLIFNKPCIILRKKTERPEGLKTGINFLTKLDKEYTKKIINQIENNKLKTKKFKNPYGEKGLTKKIVDILLK